MHLYLKITANHKMEYLIHLNQNNFITFIFFAIITASFIIFFQVPLL